MDGPRGRPVIDQAEQWRPGAAVVGWVACSTCRRRGTPWTRVPVAEPVDPAARRLAAADPWSDPEAANENRVMQECRRHIAGWQALEGVELATARQVAAGALDQAVRAALVAGATCGRHPASHRHDPSLGRRAMVHP